MSALAAAEAVKARETASLLNVYEQLPFVPIAAHGCELETADGRRILDLYGGHAVAALGYAHAELTAAIAAQAGGLTFQSNAVALDVRAEAAEALLAVAPAELTRVFFVNSGAEANENALRVALKTTERRKVLAIEHGFHGRTAAAAAVTWGAASWYGFPDTPFDVDFIPRDDVDAARDMIDDRVAAVIFEPVQGIAGAYDLCPDFVHALRERTAQVGALLIADEVQCGIGRTGRYFAVEHYGIEPDLLSSAKGLGGGVACGALLCTAEVAQKLKVGDLGSTFGGGPIAAAAIRTVLRSIERESLLDNVQAREAQIRASCLSGPVTAISGRGLLLGLHLSLPAREARNRLLDDNILTGTSSNPHVLRLLPPLVLQAAHVARLSEKLSTLGRTP